MDAVSGAFSLPVFCAPQFVEVSKTVATSEFPSWVVPAVSLISALLVAIANYAIQRWRYRIDRVSAAVDHLCGEINSAADASTRYWLLDTTQKEQDKSSKELEPELVGRQMRLQSLLLAVRSIDDGLKLDDVDEQIQELFEAMTGDEFRVAGRGQNPEKAQLVQSTAAMLNGSLRTAVGKRSQEYY